MSVMGTLKITVVDPAAVQQALELFDTDNKGALDKREVKLVLTALGWLQVPNEVLADFAAEADSEGLITYDEFKQVLATRTVEEASTEEAQVVFETFDYDRNSKIGLKDLQRIHQIVHGEEGDPALVQERINWGDLDRDGQLSETEFIDALATYHEYRPRRRQQPSAAIAAAASE